MREILGLQSFNRGLVSPLGLARVDQKRVSLSAETMTNWIPRVLGSMSLKPGTGYIGSTYTNFSPRFLDFVFATDDTALVEFTEGFMRIWIDDVLLTRVGVSTTITNETFAGNINGWTDSSESGGSISWDTGNYLRITGNGTAHGIATQALTVSVADQATEHGVRVVVARGPVTFKVGTSIGDDSIFSTAVLDTGNHSLAFTPNTGTVYLQFLNSNAYKAQIERCSMEPAGIVTIVSPYPETVLGKIRRDQSADTIFIACEGYQQRKIERRGTRPGARSWSLSIYQVDDGPFRIQNFGPTTITASALTGDITLTANHALFQPGHIGALFKIVNSVDGVSASVTAADTWTTGLKVTGSGIQRSLTITITGVSTWVAAVKLQVSPDDATWADVPGLIWNSNVTGPFLDGLDGQTRYYRIGVDSGDYSSGTIGLSLTYTSGALAGIVRVTGYTTNVSVSAQVIRDVGSTAATAVWSEGAWSNYRGYPTSTKLHESRLWWAGQNGLFGSISDSYFSYDEDVLGDSGPISRTIGSGPVDTINNIASLQRLLLLAQGAEYSVKSSAFDTPLTPTDFTIKPASTQGSGGVEAVRMDQRELYVDRTNIKLFELVFDIQTYEYSSNDLTAVVPELGRPGIVRLAIQRKPDTRIHAVRSDGTVMMGVIDKVEDVLAWFDIETTGEVEDVVVLPGAVGSTEDQVYYAIRRAINGQSYCYLEKWAKETECRGTYSDNALLNKQAESFIVFTNSPASVTVSGLDHLIGESVVVWQDGFCPEDTSTGNPKEYTVSINGTITLDTAATTGVVGLPYVAQWRSAKLGLAPSLAQTTLTQPKRLADLGVVAAWFHAKGIRFGPDFDHLDDMPRIEQGTPINLNTTRQSYDEQDFPFPGIWDTDARLCIEARAPRPVTLLALVPDLKMFS